MAHFENHLHERISGQTIDIRSRGEKRFFVFGAVVDGRPLSVFASDPHVLEVREHSSSNPQYRIFSVRVLRDVDNVRVHVGPTTNASNAWDTITIRVNNNEEQNTYNRNRIVQVANSLVGCHYVNGAAGDIPDVGNGLPGRQILHMLSPAHWPPHYRRNTEDIQNNVAWTHVSSLHTCAGKAWPYGVNDRYISHPDMSLENDTRSYRTVYIEGAKKGIVLGERCEGKRHFDCVGFISYCLFVVLGVAQRTEISAMRNSYANDCRRVEPTDPNPDLPGDILIFRGEETSELNRHGVPILLNARHIGFSVGNGREMIHAAGTGWGVVRTSIMSNLTRRVRHPRLG